MTNASNSSLMKPGTDEFKSGMTREEMDEYYRKNERLLHSILNNYVMPHGEADREDMLQYAALGFFKGMATFDKKMGVKLSTYCYQCADNEVKQYFRRISAQARKGTVIPLEAEVFDDGGGSDSRLLLDILDVPEGGINPDNQGPETLAEYSTLVQAIQRLCKTILTEMERKVLAISVYGCTQDEIAHQLHISQANVCKNLNVAKSKLVLALVEEGLISTPKKFQESKPPRKKKSKKTPDKQDETSVPEAPDTTAEAS